MKDKKYITSLQELQKYVGKVIYLCYNNDREDCMFGWALKLHSVEKTPTFGKFPLHYNILGTHIAVIRSSFTQYKNKVPCLLEKKPLENLNTSSAQTCVRELTEEEMKIYKRIIKEAEFKGYENVTTIC